MTDKKNIGKILIVDDNIITINMLKDALEVEGYQLFIATSGNKALQRAEQTLPDIILLDVLLPDIDGFETCTRLKKNNITKDIPVLFMTGLIDIENKVKGFKAGAVDYVTKPIEIEEVLSRIHTHVTFRKIQLALKEKNENLENEIEVRKEAEEEIYKLNQELEQRVEERTAELAAVNRVLKILSESNKVLAHVADEKELLQKICSIIIELGDYPYAEICYFNKGSFNTCQSIVRLISSKEIEEIFTSCESVIKKLLRSAEPDLKSGKPYFINDLKKIIPKDLLEISSNKKTPTSIIILPIIIGESIIGLLSLCTITQNSFDIGEIDLLMELVNDISFGIKSLREEIEKKKNKLEIERMNKKLKELNDTKDKFFSIIAHDLKSPFQALIGLAEILSDSKSDLSASEREEAVISLYSLLKNQYELLQNLLDWALIQQGRMICEPSKINLYEAVEKTLNLLNLNYKKKNIKVENKIEKEITAFADENMLKSILQNFITNSIKFTPREGEVNVYSSLVDEFVEIIIEDSGVGMAKEKLDKIFRLDFSSSTNGTEGEKGTGLGIILCKEMIERQGGKLNIESEERKGTKIKFTIPVKENKINISSQFVI